MDAAEILGAAPRAEFKVRTRPLEGDSKAKGLKGLNREVYALTGSTEVVEKTSTAVPVFGKKRRLAHKQAPRPPGHPTARTPACVSVLASAFLLSHKSASQSPVSARCVVAGVRNESRASVA